MKKLGIFSVSVLWIGIHSLYGQSYPYSINSWKMDDFKDRFLGSYGVASGVQPELNVESYNMAEGVYSLMSTPDLAIEYLNQGIETMATTNEAKGDEALKVEPSPGIFFLLGNLHYENGDSEQATQNYIKAITLFPNYRRVYANLGFTFMELGQQEDALPILLKAIELGVNESQVHGLVGYCYLEKGLYASAENSFRNAITFNPRYEPWRLGLLNCLIKLDLLDEAIPMAEEILYLHPERATGWMNLAALFMRVELHEKAILHFETAHQLGGAWFNSRRQLGLLYYNQKLYGKAANEFEEAIELIGNEDQMAKVLDFCSRLSYVGENTRVETLLSLVLKKGASAEIYMNQWQVDLMLAEIDISREEWDRAEERLKRLIAEKPESGQVALNLARIYVKKENLALAVAYFNIAQNSEESEYNAFVEHASLLLGQGNTMDAITKLEQAQAIDPRSNVASYIERLRAPK